MTERPNTPKPTPPTDGQTPARGTTPATPRPARPRPQFESRRVRRAPTVAQAPWYNNWRMLLPVAVIIILAIVMLGFALGQSANRAQAPAVVQPPANAPVIQVTAGAGSIPIEIVTSTPAPK